MEVRSHDRRIIIFLSDITMYFTHTAYSDILGDVQWAWLEAQLQQHTADVDLLIIASGVQIVPVKPRHVWSCDFSSNSMNGHVIFNRKNGPTTLRAGSGC